MAPLLEQLPKKVIVPMKSHIVFCAKAEITELATANESIVIINCCRSNASPRNTKANNFRA
ncbi:MAG: hypothetical protein LBD84_03385 [Campylobacteraceae bacterium]|jgi:hypothetical protein|nr:hypothetical protein [Campylobacteraceae bacterium]